MAYDSRAGSDADADTPTVRVDVYYTTFDPDAQGAEVARDIRCFGRPADVTPETFDAAYEHVTSVKIGLGRVSSRADDAVLDHVYTRLQGGRVDGELGYDGTETRSAMIGDVIALDGRAYLVGRGMAFPELGALEALAGE